MHIVFIFEKTLSWNYIIWNRLANLLGTNINRVKFARLDLYFKLVTLATAAIDTNPYGGEFRYFNINTDVLQNIFLQNYIINNKNTNGIH